MAIGVPLSVVGCNEFADYRPYVPGDDLRLVDWNVYGRLKQMVVRLFHEDRVMGIRIVLDCSASMVAHRGESRTMQQISRLCCQWWGWNTGIRCT